MKNGALSGKAEKIIVSLLEHGSIEKAAVAVGVSDVTVWRWMQKPEFQQAYQQARREAFSRSLARLQHASSAAVSTLLRVMVDKDADYVGERHTVIVKREPIGSPRFPVRVERSRRGLLGRFLQACERLHHGTPGLSRRSERL